MRKINPAPELLIPGLWKKQASTQACVDITNKEFNVPMDTSLCSQAIRDHETTHLKVSPPRELINEKLTDSERQDRRIHDAISALEDHRTNHLGTSVYGLNYEAIGDMPDMGNVFDNLSKSPPLFAAELYCSSRHYALPAAIQELLVDRIGKYKVLVDDILAGLTAEPTPDKMLKSARELVALFEKEAQEKGEKDREEAKKRKEARDKRDGACKPGEAKSKKDIKKDTQDVKNGGYSGPSKKEVTSDSSEK